MDKSPAKPPETNTTEFENFVDLTTRLLAVPKKETAKKTASKSKRKKKSNK